jgi:hypothetical protein
MEISFPTRSALDPDRFAVAFPAIVNGVQLRIFVSAEALQDHFGAIGQDDLVAVFERNRPAIERVARRMLEQGATGEVILKTAYF